CSSRRAATAFTARALLPTNSRWVIWPAVFTCGMFSPFDTGRGATSLGVAASNRSVFRRARIAGYGLLALCWLFAFAVSAHAANSLSDFLRQITGSGKTEIGPARVPAKVFPAIGGTNPPAFFDTCPNGQYLIGFKARAGAWIDNIQIICAAPDARGAF